ncbi:MAG TPA: hypothetical protein VNO70_09615 [Blastocatellia bacterium]|nr:hypothetical protein [Blastocatellia bacterium]
MKPVRALLALTCLALFTSLASPSSVSVKEIAQEAEKLVYADFETVQDKRPVTNRGGLVQLFAYQERPTFPSRFKGLEASDPPAPEVVRLSKDDPNRAIAFEFELQGSNQYAGVGVQVHGQADKDGKPVPDDVSGYKFLTMQIYVTGVSSLTVECISKGNGIEMASGYPQMAFRVSPGFNTYKIPLKSLSQPSWADVRVNPKDVLKKLTSVNVVASCNQCTPVKGTVVIDNIIFQN